MNKMCCIQTMEDYSALEISEILTHTTTWLNIGDTVISKISQSPNNKHCMIPLYEVPRKGKFIEIGTVIEVTSGWEGEGKIENNCLRGTEFLYGRRKSSRNGDSHLILH